jgi:hypothetical protein
VVFLALGSIGSSSADRSIYYPTVREEAMPTIEPSHDAVRASDLAGTQA